MKIAVSAKPGAKKESIEKIGDNKFIVRVKSMPKEGKANEAIVRMLADYFKIAPSRIKIIAGKKNKQKILELN
jgi:uncharacterized protein (TIGR00251 family)